MSPSPSHSDLPPDVLQLLKNIDKLPYNPSETENLIARMQKMSEPEIISIINCLVDIQSPSTIKIAFRTLNNKNECMNVFANFFHIVGIKGMKEVVNFGFNKIGVKATINYIKKNASKLEMDNVRYWFDID
jgi:hypothetical protein